MFEAISVLARVRFKVELFQQGWKLAPEYLRRS